MIEAAMYFVLGLLTAGLLALTVAPAIWRRAARLTRARVEASVPLSLAEIRADKDQLRAEFAMHSRRLELNVGRLEGKAAEQEVEISLRREELARLGREHGERTATLNEMEGRVAHLAGEIASSERTLAEAHADLAARDATLAERGGAFAKLQGDYEASLQLIEEQQVEGVARNTEIVNLRNQAAVAKAGEAQIALARDELAVALAEEKASLANERGRADGLQARTRDLEKNAADRIRFLGERNDEIRRLEAAMAGERDRREALAADILRLEGERDQRVAELATRAGEIERFNAEIVAAAVNRLAIEDRLAAAERALAEARSEISELRMRAEVDQMSAGDNTRKAIAATEAEKAALEVRLQGLEDEQAALRAENAELRRIAGADWEAERTDNARLRERLGAVAADILRMTQAIAAGQTESPQLVADGNGAPRKPPIARPVPPRTPANVAPGDVGPRPEGRSLAERIRALQHSAARH